MTAAERLAKVKREREAVGPVPVACRVREYRRKHGLSLRDLVEAVGGFTHESARKWEQGLYPPHLMNAYRLARFFGCQVYDLWPDTEADAGKKQKAK